MLTGNLFGHKQDFKKGGGHTKAAGLGTLSEFGMFLAIGIPKKLAHRCLWELSCPPHSKGPLGSTHCVVAFELIVKVSLC